MMITRTALPMAATITVGAGLFFVIQPLIANLLTPLFGGAASVWLVCLLFFQTTLLAGYLYAHLLTRWVALRPQIIVHGVLTLAAAAATIMLPADPAPRSGIDPGLEVLRLLSITVALPVILLAATSPLVQHWYQFHSQRPYRLYALSNAAAIGVLLAYPFLIEPVSDIDWQFDAWCIGLVIYAATTLVIAAISPSATPSPTQPTTMPRISYRERLVWFALPAVGTTLLVSASTVITQEIAPMPLLWILPLATYLLSWVITFDHARWYSPRIFVPLFIIALAGAVAWLWNPDSLGMAAILGLFTILLFAGCMICHGELARRKPDPIRLTEFYLWLALGGAAGSAAASIGAPLLLKDVYELHIALVLVIAVSCLALPPTWRRVGAGVTVAVALALGSTAWHHASQAVDQHRTFYSRYSIEEVPPVADASAARILRSNGVVHGAQLIGERQRKVPRAYYGRNSGVGIAIDTVDHPRRRIGAVGLGVGTIAAYGRPDDEIIFYELDESVESLARLHFTYLEDSAARISVASGDARLTLAAEDRNEARPLDILVIDAFTGDAIPFHLLTREAWALYWRRLKPSGVLAIHISSKFIDLTPVILANNQGSDRSVFLIDNYGNDDIQIYSSNWVLVTRHREVVHSKRVGEPMGAECRQLTWTDQRHSLTTLLTAQPLRRDCSGSG